MNRSRQFHFWLWRINAQFWQTRWWIILALVAGAALGQAISQSYPDQRDLWHVIGIIGGLSVGILISFLVWNNSSTAQVNRGNRYVAEKKFKEAVDSYTKAIRSLPRHPKYLLRRGIAYQGAGNLIAALADYGKAIDLKPNYAMAYAYRAEAYLIQEDYSNAIDHYTIAIDLNIRVPKVYMGRAVAYYRVGKQDLALIDLANVLRLQPDAADAYYLYGKIYQEQDMTSQAVAHYQKALELQPDHDKAAEMRQYIEQVKVRAN